MDDKPINKHPPMYTYNQKRYDQNSVKETHQQLSPDRKTLQYRKLYNSLLPPFLNISLFRDRDSNTDYIRSKMNGYTVIHSKIRLYTSDSEKAQTSNNMERREYFSVVSTVVTLYS